MFTQVTSDVGGHAMHKRPFMEEETRFSLYILPVHYLKVITRVSYCSFHYLLCFFVAHGGDVWL